MNQAMKDRLKIQDAHDFLIHFELNPESPVLAQCVELANQANPQNPTTREDVIQTFLDYAMPLCWMLDCHCFGGFEKYVQDLIVGINYDEKDSQYLTRLKFVAQRDEKLTEKEKTGRFYFEILKALGTNKFSACLPLSLPEAERVFRFSTALSWSLDYEGEIGLVFAAILDRLKLAFRKFGGIVKIFDEPQQMTPETYREVAKDMAKDAKKMRTAVDSFLKNRKQNARFN
jgi:hypothetical protein